MRSTNDDLFTLLRPRKKIYREYMMGNPFQDQLLKAGLVSRKQARKVKREKFLNRRQNKEINSSAASEKAQKELAAQAKRNRDLDLKRSQEKRKLELKAQVKQLIENNRQDLDDQGESYHFTEKNMIQRIFVSASMKDQLSRGQLAIVKLGDSYEVVPARVARQIAGRDKHTVIAFHEGSR